MGDTLGLVLALVTTRDREEQLKWTSLSCGIRNGLNWIWGLILNRFEEWGKEGGRGSWRLYRQSSMTTQFALPQTVELLHGLEASVVEANCQLTAYKSRIMAIQSCKWFGTWQSDYKSDRLAGGGQIRASSNRQTL